MNQVAVVTGAARGIGRATVRRLAEQGWQVVAVDVCADIAGAGYHLGTRDELAALAREWPDQVRDAVADVRDPAAVEEAVALAEREFGHVDAAVAAAAIIAGGDALWESDESTWDAQWNALFDIGVRGTANLARAVIPRLLARPRPRGGRFVALASAAGHRGLWHLSAYNSAKHAVVGLIKGLATDLRGTGVSAVAVSPGSTDTPMLAATAALYELDDVTEFAKHQLVERLLDPGEIAATVSWLCCAESSAITGSVVHADGGFTT